MVISCGQMNIRRRLVWSVLVWAVLGLCLVGLSATGAWAESGGRGQLKIQLGATADRDSLLAEIEYYSRMVGTWRDTLSENGEGFALTGEQRDRLQKSIGDISKVIESIGEELSGLALEISDNRISLVNEAGEGIVINIPENLDEQVSAGIEAIAGAILQELPDSVSFAHPRHWDWSGFGSNKQVVPRHVRYGNVVKIGETAVVSAEEDVRGNVVVIFGDAEIAGRVSGSVVCVWGNLVLRDTAEVEGRVVVTGGSLERDAGAAVQDVVTIDPWQNGRSRGWSGLFGYGWLMALASQGFFMLTVLAAISVVVVWPQRRLDSALAALRGAPMPSLGLGVLAAVLGHSVVLSLMVVLVLTLIGVPLALLVVLAILAVAVLAVALYGVVLGDWLCLRFGASCPHRWQSVVVGLTALHLVSFAGAVLGAVSPFRGLASLVIGLGMTIKLGAYLIGLGALVLSRFGSKVPQGID